MHKQFDDDLREFYGKNIVGIDEVGRGAWVGPIVAAAVCLPPDFDLISLTDSKKMSEKKRKECYEIIKSEAIAFSIQEVSANQIDQNGITWANITVMDLAGKEVESAIGEVNLFVIDQSPCKTLKPRIVFPKADSFSMSVAAASVLAKVYRDELMCELSKQYPEYCYEQNKGYIDKKHVEIVNKLGVISGIYRESYKVKGYNKPSQLKLV